GVCCHGQTTLLGCSSSCRRLSSARLCVLVHPGRFVSALLGRLHRVVVASTRKARLYRVRPGFRASRFGRLPTAFSAIEQFPPRQRPARSTAAGPLSLSRRPPSPVPGTGLYPLVRRLCGLLAVFHQCGP